MKHLLLSLILSLIPALAAAQLAGRVVDEQSQPVAYANVVTLRAADSTFIAGTTTATAGTFSLPQPGEQALLRVTLVGYEPLYLPLSQETRLGDLTLRAEGTQMGEATVTAVRPVARVEGDALVTDIKGTTLENEGTAGDVLAKVPGIMRSKTDGGDSYEVLGKGTPVFYINGREVRDQSELDRLRSDEIKSVEVVHNPGAGYAADVAAVVRIRTVRRQGEGFGVNASTTYEQGRYGKGNARLNLNYRHKSLELFLGGSYEQSRYYWDASNDQTVHADTLWTLASKQHSSGVGKNYGFNTGFNYDLSENHAFGLRYEFSHTFSSHFDGYYNSDVLADGVYNDRLENAFTGNTDADPTHSLNAYYNGHIGTGELSVNADFYATGNSSRNGFDEQSAEKDDRNITSTENVRNRLAAGKAQYAFPLLGGSFTVGGQYTFTDRHDDYLTPIDDYGISTALSQLREQNAAAFVQYARPVKIGQLAVGLRYEHVRFDYYENHLRLADQSRRYDNLFPSLSLNTQIGHTQLMLSYTAKTDRPAYYQLSNSVTYANRFLLQSGNPLLKPTIKHNVSAVAVWKWLQGMVWFAQHKDDILYWGTSMPESPQTTKITYINKDVSAYSAMLTAAPTIGLWHPTATAYLQGQVLELQTATSTRRFNNPRFIGMLNNAFRLPADFTFNVDYTFASRGHYDNVRMVRSIHLLNLSLQKQLLRDNRLTLILNANDLFHREGGHSYLYMENSELLQAGSGDTRTFGITLRYKFNTSRSGYKGETTLEDELQRIGSAK